MKDAEEVNQWLQGTIRAWLVAQESDMETRLYAEAIALIWVLHLDTTWAGARAIFEEMRVKVDKELSWSHIEQKEQPPDDPT